MLQPSVHLRIDRSKPLHLQPGAGHNRWHPDIPAVARANPGEVVAFETVDCDDGYITPEWTGERLATMPPGVVHPLTGPLHIVGAEPGDILEVEIIEIIPQARGHTMHAPRFGFLRDLFPEPYMVHWEIRGGYATSRQLPGIRLPAILHMGVMGVAPSRELLQQINTREEELAARGGSVSPPAAVGAVPADPAIADHACRTFAPHENGGNLDIRHLTPGTTLRLPVHVDGALFSTGDAHFSQGDGESCGTAIEIGATAFLRFNVLKGHAKKHNIRDVQFYRTTPDPAPQRPYFATTGTSHNWRKLGDKPSLSEDLHTATRNALLSMIDYLESERGLTRQQAYLLCSVAVDLKIIQLVDLPNVMVSAHVPTDIFVPSAGTR
jgi:formamidase